MIYLIAALLVIIASYFLLRWFEAAAMFQPSRKHMLTPEQFSISYEELQLPSGDAKIYGWLVKAEQPNGKTILYLHGNAGNISDRLPVVTGLSKHGFQVLIFDYRGYGKSGGKPTRNGIVEDSLTAYRWLTEEKKVKAEDILLLGQSLGGAAALRLANQVPAGGLALEGCFFSVRELAKDLFSPLPLWLAATKDFNNGEQISKINLPLLIIYGTEDEVIPIRHSKMLFDAAKKNQSGEDKLLLSFEGSDHTGMYGQEKYYTAYRKLMAV